MRHRKRRWPLRLLATAGVLGLLLTAAVFLSTDGFLTFGAKASGSRLERVNASPNHSDGVFVNAEPTTLVAPRAFLPILWEQLTGNQMRVPNCPLPISADGVRTLGTPPTSGLRITWLGHSTTLVELDGARILTDPHWSPRASPSRWAGPARFHPPPIPLDALPKVDAVVISHDHYDHLDMDTVRALSARGATFYVGLGVGAHLEKWGVPTKRIVEADAWESFSLPNGITLVATPTRHFSGRGPLKRNDTRWTSWSMVGPKHRVFFSGDTGLTGQFRTVAERLGPFDVAMLEIGASNPAWGDIHLGPANALAAFDLLGAKHFFPIHWSTFNLALHPWSEPAETLFDLAASRRVSLVTPLLGEPVEPTEGPRTGAWWRALPPIAPGCPPVVAPPPLAPSDRRERPDGGSGAGRKAKGRAATAR